MGRWVRLCALMLVGWWCVASLTAQTPADVFNVKTFGARGDNTGDDGPAITAALAAAAPSAGTVYFPPGTYPLANPIKPAADVTLLGAGNQAAFLTPSKLGTYGNRGLIEVRADRVQIRDLGFVGAGAGYQGVTLLGVKDVKVDHCWFDGDFWWSVFVGSSSRGVRITSVISEGTRGAHNIELNDSSYCEISDCHLKNSKANGIEVYQRTAGESVGSRIIRNDIERPANAGVALLGDRQTVVAKNTIRDAVGNGVRGIYSEVLGPNYPSLGVIVADNTFVGNGVASGQHGLSLAPGTVAWTVQGNSIKTSGNCGVYLGGIAHTVVGNTVSENQGHGIYIGAGSGNVVSDNVALDNSVIGAGARDGIRISGTTGNTVTGNRSGSSGGAPLQGYGIMLLSNALNNTVAGNQGTGNKYASVVDLGSGNTLTGNR